MPVSRHVPPKALLLTFFINGDRFSSGTRISIRPGRDFKSVSLLCDYLTQRLKVPWGVRSPEDDQKRDIKLLSAISMVLAVRPEFVVCNTLLYHLFREGQRIFFLDELRDGGSYVLSSSARFQDLAYGVSARMRSARLRPAAMREEDAKLFRDLHPKPPTLPSQKEQQHRILTVVNGFDPRYRTRVLLNSKAKGIHFDRIIADLGQTVRLRNAVRMYTPWGREVRSFSQLRLDFRDVSTFYLDEGQAMRSNASFTSYNHRN